LSSSDESEKLDFFELSWTPAGLATLHLPRGAKLYHGHEMTAFQTLAQLASLGRLWSQ
jgi:hypothetical protein